MQNCDQVAAVIAPSLKILCCKINPRIPLRVIFDEHNLSVSSQNVSCLLNVTSNRHLRFCQVLYCAYKPQGRRQLGQSKICGRDKEELWDGKDVKSFCSEILIESHGF